MIPVRVHGDDVFTGKPRASGDDPLPVNIFGALHL